MDLIQSEPNYEQRIEVDLLKHAIEKGKGSKGGRLHLQHPTRMLLTAMAGKSNACTRFFTANVKSLSERTIRRNNAHITKKITKVHGNSFIDKSEEQMVNQLCEVVEERFNLRLLEKGDPFGFSFSVDGTAVVKGVYVHPQSDKVVGGAYPHHAVDVPEDTDELWSLLNKFTENKTSGGKQKAAEVKIATLVMQGTVHGESLMYQFYGQPQTKNMSSDFNNEMNSIGEAVEVEMRKRNSEAYANVNYIGLFVDGVSCDSSDVQEGFLGFLAGKSNFTCHTDTNHNCKSARYVTAHALFSTYKSSY